MGGGGSGPGRIGDIDSLIDRAKKALGAEEAQSRRNVFISFAYEDVATVNLLRGQARNEKVPLEFNDWSVSEPIDSERANYIKAKISERISRSSVTVVFLTEATPGSAWVNWEIAESIRMGKHVVGVFPSGRQPTTFPKAIRDNAVSCVAWPELASTIERLP